MIPLEVKHSEAREKAARERWIISVVAVVVYLFYFIELMAQLKIAFKCIPFLGTHLALA